jgi:hypothetical protein
MGGNALKEFGVKRVDRKTYERIRDYVLTKLPEITSKAAVPYFLDDKDDFGDVDVLAILQPEASATLKQWLETTFAPRAIIHNGNVWSFNVEDLQIDLITTSEANYEIYFTFLCWGDLSMTMGRVSRLWDLKYGIEGLEFPMRDPETNHVMHTIPISKNPRKIFEFMGYSFDRWLEGFTNAVTLREYLFSSPRIHKGFLDARSSNTKHYKRDFSRKMYSEWFAWFQANLDKFPEEAALPMPKTTDEKLTYVENVFPESNLRAEYNRLQKEMTDNILARDKFSGRHMMSLFPDVTGRKFGALMELWTKQWSTKNEQVAYILSHEVAHLEDLAHKVRKELVFNE